MNYFYDDVHNFVDVDDGVGVDFGDCVDNDVVDVVDVAVDVSLDIAVDIDVAVDVDGMNGYFVEDIYLWCLRFCRVSYYLCSHLDIREMKDVMALGSIIG